MGGDAVFTRMRKTRPGLLLSSSVLIAVLAGAVANAAIAAPAYNMTGTWTTGYRSGSTLDEQNGTWDITTMNMSTGEFSGTAEIDGGQFTLTGTESGSEVQQELTEGSYTAHDVYTLSVLSSGHVGTDNGTFDGGGEFWAEQSSTSAEEPGKKTKEEESTKKAKEEEAAKKAKEEAEKAKRPSATMITCNYEFATSENTCLASVGDAGTGTPVTPTGTVTFTTTSGGFSSGATCSLTPESTSPSIASCTLIYQTANSGLPEITATYGGDARHTGSVGHTQFLGAGSSEGTAETPPGKPGEYPNEIDLGLEVPVSNTTVEGVAQEPAHSPAPVPMTLPQVEGLDSVSPGDLQLVESDAKKVDNSGAQNAQEVKELDQSIEKLNQRAVEVMHSMTPAEQAETQKLTKDTNETIESISKMLKKQQELELQIAKNVRTSAFSASTHKHAKKPKTKKVKPLAHVVEGHVAAGKLKLVLKLNKAALKKLAGKRNSLTVSVRVDMLLPSGLYKGGLPRAFVESITLKRTPAGKHAAHKKH